MKVYKEHVSHTIDKSVFDRLEEHHVKSHLSKSVIVNLALKSYLPVNLENLSKEEAKKLMSETYDNIERLIKLREELYEILANE